MQRPEFSFSGVWKSVFQLPGDHEYLGGDPRLQPHEGRKGMLKELPNDLTSLGSLRGRRQFSSWH